MPKSVALTMACLTCLQDEIAKESVRGWEHGWAGFQSGSFVTFQEVSLIPEVNAQGKETMFRELKQVATWTVTSVESARVTVKAASEDRQSEIPFSTQLPTYLRGKGERHGEEEISVGAVRYSCRVYTLTLDAEREVSQKTTIWKAAEAPAWAVKVLVETFQKGERNTWEEERLVAEGEKLLVAGREVSCQVFQVTTDAEGGGRCVKKEWRSAQVPGRVVRRETRYFRGDREIEGAATKMEVVRFEARK